MEYRGKECIESRPYSTATETGTEWRDPADTAPAWAPGTYCYRQAATRVVSPEEIAAAAAKLGLGTKQAARLVKLAGWVAEFQANGTLTAAKQLKATMVLAKYLLQDVSSDAGL